MSRLDGLKKADLNSEKNDQIENFVKSASVKANSEIDTEIDKEYRNAKRDQSFLLRINHYENELINKAFEKTKFRSKLELVRSLLIPELERVVKEENPI